MDKQSLKDWCPSHQAIALIYTGDENLALELGEKPVGVGLLFTEFLFFELNPQLNAQRSSLLPADATEARKILEDALAQGEVQTDGAYFERRSCLNGSGVIENTFERDEIPLSKLRGLRFHEDNQGGQIRNCLISRDDIAARGSNWGNLRGYRDIYHYTPDIRRLLQQRACKRSVRPRAAPPAIRIWVENYLSQTQRASQSGAWSRARTELRPPPTRAQFEAIFKEKADRVGISIRAGRPSKA